ncbi:hypothetical protein [Mycolicibacterium mageritense]|uniref:hypothetical protein n=1 Tax=Mycolicibacterium mageritense TaxID=53462 RepID=UPI0011D96A11|nr:hypothetical protein [Mycolicibacterium mageritense]TXI54409.1 MAG: hypothetical protein E6Q55_32920 [Mycolicibacterium mageritense]
MTENMIDTEARWRERDLPPAAASASMVSAWSTDAGIARQAAELAAVYGNEYDVDTTLRLFRSQLRAAAMATAASDVTARERAVLCDLYLDAEASQDELEDAARHLVDELGVDMSRARELVTQRLCEAAAAPISHAGPATMSPDQVLVQSVLDAGVAELVDAKTSDEVIAALVTAAELGHDEPIPGLREALVSIRDGERDGHAARMELADVLADVRAASGVQIASLVTAAEAGRGGAIEGLARAVTARVSEEMQRRA